MMMMMMAEVQGGDGDGGMARAGKLPDVGVAAMSVLAVLVISIIANQTLQRRRRRLPPGPWPWPIVGNFPQLSKAKDVPHRSLRALAAKYGGLMFLRLGTKPCIVVSSASVAEELFQTNDANFSSRPTRLYWTVRSGNTEYKDFGAPYGKYWRQLRKLCNSELFSPKRQASYEKARTEEVHDMLHSVLEESRNGNALNLKLKLYGVAANTMTRMLTNKRYYGHRAKDQQEKEDLEEMIIRTHHATATFIISDYVPFLSFIPKLQGYHSEFKRIYKFETSVTNKVFEVERHRERAKERLQGHNDEADYVPDFVDVLLASPLGGGELLSDRSIVTVLTNMLTGGTDTASTTVEWAMAELILHPEVMKRAQGELEAVVGPTRLVQESDIPNLPYLQAVVKEVYRMHPAAPLALPRLSTEASTICGYHLPPKTYLTLNIFAIHRDPRVYEAPDTFNPQRFLDRPDVSPTSGFSSYQLIPFSAGRRMCPAYALGDLMASLLLAHLLHTFDWTLPDDLTRSAGDRIDMSEDFGLVMCKKVPLSLVAHPKSPAFLLRTGLT